MNNDQTTLDHLADQLRRRAPHAVPNPSDFYVYTLAAELHAAGHTSIRQLDTSDVDERIRRNTLQPEPAANAPATITVAPADRAEGTTLRLGWGVFDFTVDDMEPLEWHPNLGDAAAAAIRRAAKIGPDTRVEVLHDTDVEDYLSAD